MEDLHVQQKGSVYVSLNMILILSLDEKHKPGLYAQVEEFISGTNYRLTIYQTTYM